MGNSKRSIVIQISCQENACDSCKFCINYFNPGQTVRRCIIFDKNLVQTPQGIERLKECKEKEI